MSEDPLKFWRGLVIGLPLALLAWVCLIWLACHLLDLSWCRSSPIVGLLPPRGNPFICFPAHPMPKSSSTGGMTTNGIREQWR